MPGARPALAAIHESFRKGRLEYLVGAGASIASGLPGWNELSRRLIGEFLGAKHAELALIERDVQGIASEFASRLGRETIVDVIRAETGARFNGMLRRALYGGQHFEPDTIHFELAVTLATARRNMHPPLGLLTLNFDLLLEQAGERLTGAPLTAVTEGVPRRGPHVLHLHGVLPPTGKPHGHLILSEFDYWSTTSGWATCELIDVLESPHKDLLLVGLSLTDPRLRSVLLTRRQAIARLRAARRRHVGRVFLLMPEREADYDAELLDRLAAGLASEYEQRLWESWQLEVVPSASYALLPFQLRQIRLGPDPRVWTEMGQIFLTDHSATYARLYENDTQLRVLAALREGVAFFRSRFAVGRDEETHIGVFVPNSDRRGQLRMAFHLKSDLAASVVTKAYADDRVLDVSRLDAPQGAAGYAFLQGVVGEARRDSPMLDAGFTKSMLANWGSAKTFSAVLSVPVYASPEWVPIGVVYVTSNAYEPFWTRLNVPDYADLQVFLRTLFAGVMGYS